MRLLIAIQYPQLKKIKISYLSKIALSKDSE
jgi:hypothetical protein